MHLLLDIIYIFVIKGQSYAIVHNMTAYKSNGYADLHRMLSDSLIFQ